MSEVTFGKEFFLNLQVSVVGLGLMGGSLVRAIRPYGVKITAVDPNQDALDAALAARVIDWGTADLSEGVSRSDLVILATPVRTILEILEQLPQLCPGGYMVLDLGSTKGEVCAAMERLPPVFQAIGGHPMCGKESSGFAEAEADLFRDRSFVLCRTERTTAEMEGTALAVVAAVGGRPLFLPPELHDELVAVTSHLPYLAAAVLMRQATEAAAGEERLWAVSASGFRDSSRLAGSSPAVMGDILLTNRTAVLARLGRYREGLSELIDLLERGEEAELLAWLAKAQRGYWDYRGYGSLE